MMPTTFTLLTMLSITLRICLLSSPSISTYLGLRLDLSTRLTSYRCVEEALMGRQVMHWEEGEGAHRPPLIAAGLVQHVLTNNTWIKMGFFIMVDLVTAWAIWASVGHRMASEMDAGKEEDRLLEQWRALGRPRLPSDDANTEAHTTEDDTAAVIEDRVTSGELQDPPALPEIVALVYLLNPLTILTCGAKSFAPLTFMFAVVAIASAQHKHAVVSAICLACVTYLDGLSWFMMLCLPLTTILSTTRPILLLWTTFSFTLSALVAISYVMEDYSWGWIHHVYIWPYTYPDLSPNPGLFFYLFASTFSRFRQYFLICLNAFPFFFVVPLHVHFSLKQQTKKSVFQAFIGLAIVMLYQPYQELFHVAGALVCLFCFPRYSLASQYVGYLLLILCGSLVLQPLMLYSWIEDRTGNANYYYFQTLAANVIMAGLIVLTIQAPIRRDRALARMARKVKKE